MVNVYQAPQSDLRPEVGMIEHRTLDNPIAWNGRIGRLRFILQLQAMLSLSFLLAVAAVVVVGIYRAQQRLPNLSDSDTAFLISAILFPSTLFSLVFCCRRRIQDFNLPSWLGLISIFVYAALIPRWVGVDSFAFNEIAQIFSFVSLFFLLCLVLIPGKKKENVFGCASPANTLRLVWYLLPTSIVAWVLFLFRPQ